MKMGTEFWVAHVAAVKLEAISASEYARRRGLSVMGSINMKTPQPCESPFDRLGHWGFLFFPTIN